MRGSDRIKPFLEEFEKFWLQHPDLRFGQIVANMYGIGTTFESKDGLDLKKKIYGCDPYHFEDEDSLKLLKVLERKV